jgi:hypothetical protein
MATPGEKRETEALAREIGQRSADRLEAGLVRLMEDTSATGRWLLGSLVTLNGGGIVAMATGREAFNIQAIAPAIYYFVFGATIAVLAALVTMIAAVMLGRDYGEANALWTQVGLTGDITEEAMASAKRLKRKGLYWSGTSIGIGLVSLLLFMAGALTLADGIAPAAQSDAVDSAVVPLNVGTPPLPVSEPKSKPVPLENTAQLPTVTPTPEVKAPPSKPEPRRTPRRNIPRAPETAPANLPPATPAPAQQSPAQPSSN